MGRSKLGKSLNVEAVLGVMRAVECGRRIQADPGKVGRAIQALMRHRSFP